MDIKEIALKVAMDTGLYLDGANQSEPFYVVKPEEIVEFAEALISAYKAELLKEVGEPVGLVTFVDGECYAELSDTAKLVEFDELFTSDQVAAAILKAEQRVSESCAALCDHLQTIQQFGENGYGCEAAITRGEWRKFVKEV